MARKDKGGRSKVREHPRKNRGDGDKVFPVKTRIGKERAAIERIAKRARKKGVTGIQGLLHLEGVKGYILVEASDKNSVRKLCRGVKDVEKVVDDSLGMSLTRSFMDRGVSITEYEPKEGDTVEVITGQHRAEKATVVKRGRRPVVRPKVELEMGGARDKALKFFGPILLFFIAAGIMVVALGWEIGREVIALMLAYMVPPAGKETIIPVAILARDINWVVISLAIAYQDIITALFLVYNFNYARKIPLLGPWIAKFEKANANILKEKPWFRNMIFLGLVLFVIVPFQGSGGVGGSVMGRIVGMKPWRVFTAISVGTISGCLMIGFIAKTVGDALFASLKTTEAKVIGTIVVVIVILTFYLALRRFKERQRERSSRVVTEDDDAEE